MHYYVRYVVGFLCFFLSCVSLHENKICINEIVNGILEKEGRGRKKGGEGRDETGVA